MENIILENVSFSYDKEETIQNMNLTLQEGKLTTLLGASGCGKTTILRLIAGFLTPQSGSIKIGDRDITNVPPEKRNISTVFQNYALFMNMTVKENVAYGLKIRRESKKVIDEKCEKYLELIHMNDYSNKKIDELSGGQQQRVSIARALAIEPKMLLMDEPMSNLDAALRVEMREEFRAIQKQTGITTMFITHDQQEALQISDKIYVMDRGKILQGGTPEKLYFQPEDMRVASVVGSVNVLTQKQREALKKITKRAESTVFRPEDLGLSTENTGAPFVCGSIDDVRFGGMYTEYEVALEDGTIRIVEMNISDGRNIKKVGEQVFIYER